MSPLLTAGTRSHDDRVHFIGQVIDHLSSNLMSVSSLGENGAYRAYGMASSEFPIGAVVECVLSEDNAFVEELYLVDPQTKAEYRNKLIIPAA